jgi:hypothetical protein
MTHTEINARAVLNQVGGVVEVYAGDESHGYEVDAVSYPTEYPTCVILVTDQRGERHPFLVTVKPLIEWPSARERMAVSDRVAAARHAAEERAPGDGMPMNLVERTDDKPGWGELPNGPRTFPHPAAFVHVGITRDECPICVPDAAERRPRFSLVDDRDEPDTDEYADGSGNRGAELPDPQS